MALLGNKAENGKRQVELASQLHNDISKGTLIKGDLESNGNIRIEGQIIGNVTSLAKIVIGEDGSIDGNITVSNAEISGKINGNVTVQNVLTLKSNAKVKGDIKASRLIIEEGALYNGQCTMGELKIEIKLQNPSSPS